MQNVNVIVITGNLTKDPELTSFESGSSVCELRVAVNTSRKNGQTGEWEDKPNYFDVKVWNKRGVACSEHLEKGSPIAVQGRLDWREWEAKDGSGKRQKVEIFATDVQFLGTGNGPKDSTLAEEPVPAGGGELAMAGAGGGDDDIQF